MNSQYILLGVILIAALVIMRAGLIRRTVYTGQVGLLYRKEKLLETLEPGIYRRFDPFRVERMATVSTIPTALNPNQYEVISKDQFAFRVTLTPLITITDPREFHENTAQISQEMAQFYPGIEQHYSRLSPVLSNGVIEAIGAKNLEEFLADPANALEGLEEKVAAVLPGTQLDGIAITSINLPPEVRKMFTEVERARKEGLAGLERSKAEQASLRALANAARNIAGNPQLAQLRILQTLENAKGAKTFVLGSAPELVQGDAIDKSLSYVRPLPLRSGCNTDSDQ